MVTCKDTVPSTETTATVVQFKKQHSLRVSYFSKANWFLSIIASLLLLHKHRIYGYNTK